MQEISIRRIAKIATEVYTVNSYDYRNRLTAATEYSSANSVWHNFTATFDVFDQCCSGTLPGRDLFTTVLLAECCGEEAPTPVPTPPLT